MTRRFRTGLAVAAFASLVALAGPIAAQGAKAEGEVRRIDKETGKITIRHGPVKEFDMGAMTMVFRVVDPAILERFKSGDRIRFELDKIGGQFTVLSAESAP